MPGLNPLPKSRVRGSLEAAEAELPMGGGLHTAGAASAAALQAAVLQEPADWPSWIPAA